jgi:hypothetical protein
MRSEHPRGQRCRRVARRGRYSSAQRGFDFCSADASGAQKHRSPTGKADDGRLDPDRRRTGVEDHTDFVAKILGDMSGGCWAHTAGSVGAWCRDRLAKRGQQRLRHRVGGNPDGNRVEPRRHQIDDPGVSAPRHHQR